MGNLRKTILSKFLLALVITGIALFNFSVSAALLMCETETECESSCCASECSSHEQAITEETVYEQCNCFIAQAAEQSRIEKNLIHSSAQQINVNPPSKIIAGDFPEIKNSKSSYHFFNSSGKPVYALKDVYLFNSILRI